MYMVLGAVAVGVAALAWLSSIENEERNRYYTNKSRLTQETKTRTAQLAKARAQRYDDMRFYENIQLHYAAMQTANACFENYSQHKKLKQMMEQKTQLFIENIIHLKAQIKVANKQAKPSLYEQLNQYREYLRQAREQIELLKLEKNHLYQQMQEMNAKTASYRDYIRDNCGRKGRDWYNNRLTHG